MMSTTTRGRRLRALIIGILAAGALSACGSANGSDGEVASLGSTAEASDNSATSGTADSVPTSVDPQEAFTEYTQCMRDEGIDMPDPQVISAEPGEGQQGGQTINVSDSIPPGERPNVDFNSDEFKAAEEKCKPILDNAVGQIEIDPEVQAEHREQMLEFAKCMRDHGIDFPDPQFSDDGGISVQIGSADEGDAPPFDPTSDEFEAASKACGDFMDGGFVVSGSSKAGD